MDIGYTHIMILHIHIYVAAVAVFTCVFVCLVLYASDIACAKLRMPLCVPHLCSECVLVSSQCVIYMLLLLV